MRGLFVLCEGEVGDIPVWVGIRRVRGVDLRGGEQAGGEGVLMDCPSL